VLKGVAQGNEWTQHVLNCYEQMQKNVGEPFVLASPHTAFPGDEHKNQLLQGDPNGWWVGDKICESP
jgi:hypothetical protein